MDAIVERTMGKGPKAPFADMKIADFIARQIEIVGTSALGRPGKTQREIAAELGYDKPNMISMFKTGMAKVPLEKVPALAKAINVDPAFLFRLALQQYWPDNLDTIAEIFGTICTKN